MVTRFEDLTIKLTSKKVEKTQWKATRMIKSIRNLDYEGLLKVLNLPSLHYRRYRGDMIAIRMYLHDKYDIDYPDFFYFFTHYPYQRSHI